MIRPANTAPMLCSPSTAPGGQGHELLDRALNDLEKEDQWVNDFIKRLHYAVEDLGHKKNE